MARKGHKGHKVGKKGHKKGHKGVTLHPTLKHMGKKGGHKKHGGRKRHGKK